MNGGFDMAKDTSISIRLDSHLKEQAECVLDQLGLSMTVVINMLFNQIVRDQAVPLSLSLKPRNNAISEINSAVADRTAGYNGRTAESVAADMDRIISEAENGKKKV
jgi:addiction module RelB/DinJ family antitoxin